MPEVHQRSELRDSPIPFPRQKERKSMKREEHRCGEKEERRKEKDLKSPSQIVNNSRRGSVLDGAKGGNGLLKMLEIG